MKPISWVAVALVPAALAAGSAQAQTSATPARSGTRGPVLGFDLNGSALDVPSSLTGAPGGAGLGLSLGYGVSDRVSLFTRAGVGYRIGYVDVGARYSFGGAEARLRPYLDGALTRTGTSAFAGPFYEPAHSRGYGVTGGAGVEYFVIRHVALDVGLSHSRGQFTSGTFDGDRFSSTRLNLGVKWHP
ncbi:MAG: hypothetical protein ACJ8GN_19485 [Longimicrobiaceae bacterium]